MDDKDIAIVSVAGVIEAKKVGKTTLTARSIGQDKKGNTVVFSEVIIFIALSSRDYFNFYVESNFSFLVLISHLALFM